MFGESLRNFLSAGKLICSVNTKNPNLVNVINRFTKIGFNYKKMFKNSNLYGIIFHWDNLTEDMLSKARKIENVSFILPCTR